MSMLFSCWRTEVWYPGIKSIDAKFPESEEDKIVSSANY